MCLQGLSHSCGAETFDFYWDCWVDSMVILPNDETVKSIKPQEGSWVDLKDYYQAQSKEKQIRIQFSDLDPFFLPHHRPITPSTNHQSVTVEMTHVTFSICVEEFKWEFSLFFSLVHIIWNSEHFVWEVPQSMSGE